jgi:hypothetical protein
MRAHGAQIDTVGNYLAPQPNSASITASNWEHGDESFVGIPDRSVDVVFGATEAAGARIYREWQSILHGSAKHDANVVWYWVSPPTLADEEFLSACLLEGS